jgi:hypothetical protein
MPTRGVSAGSEDPGVEIEPSSRHEEEGRDSKDAHSCLSLASAVSGSIGILLVVVCRGRWLALRSASVVVVVLVVL